MDRKLITAADFAKSKNIEHYKVTRAKESDLKDAFFGNRIDINHPQAIHFAKVNAVDQTNIHENPDYQRVRNEMLVNPGLSSAEISAKLGMIPSRVKEFFYHVKLNASHEPPAARVLSPEIVKLELIESAAITPTPEKKTFAKKIKNLDQFETNAVDIPDDIYELRHLTIEQIANQFGTDTRFKDYISVIKDIEAIHEKRLKNAKMERLLVSRNAVTVGIIDPINSVFLKLLTDGAKTIAMRVIAMTAANCSQKDIEKFVKDQIASFIRPVKSKIKRVLADV